MTGRHVLVTNDFPPKVGGIQSYLWELWRRLPAGDVTVLTTPHPDAAVFDATQPFRIERTREAVLLPTPSLRSRINQLAAEVEASFVVLDPALPLGLIGPALDLPYSVIVHGAEITLPGRLPAVRRALKRVLTGACHVVAAGGYPLAEAEQAAGRPLAHTVIPPGVDPRRFRPLEEAERTAARSRFDLPVDAPVVLTLSRLVPRKGVDVVLAAVARLRDQLPDVMVTVAGSGRDRSRLERIARSTGAPARFLGRVPDEDLPALYGCADVFAMLCRNRWGGLEQEGFGIVFLEAAAAGVPSVAGRSGGAHEAVVHGRTGAIVDDPTDVAAVAEAIRHRLVDHRLRAAESAAARARAEHELSYDHLASRLARTLTELTGRFAG
jgi:phosphatidylinositol alpha-1,6-mannosyltransferase